MKTNPLKKARHYHRQRHGDWHRHARHGETACRGTSVIDGRSAGEVSMTDLGIAARRELTGDTEDSETEQAIEGAPESIDGIPFMDPQEARQGRTPARMRMKRGIATVPDSLKKGSKRLITTGCCRPQSFPSSKKPMGSYFLPGMLRESPINLGLLH